MRGLQGSREFEQYCCESANANAHADALAGEDGASIIKRSFLPLQHRSQVGKWIMGCHGRLITGFPSPYRLIQKACMLVFVAVQTKQFPIAAVQWVVVVIVVLMVNRQLAQAYARELAAASPANPWKQFERPLAIGCFTLLALAASLGNDAVEP